MRELRGGSGEGRGRPSDEVEGREAAIDSLDLVVLYADPLADISAVRRVNMVIKDGQRVSMSGV